jgi:hypothetical protein
MSEKMTLAEDLTFTVLRMEAGGGPRWAMQRADVMKSRLLVSAMRPVILALSLTLLSPWVARADTFNFLDSGESVSVTINGVTITGNGGRVSNFLNVGESVTFDLTFMTSLPPPTESGFTNLLEPGSTTVSDRFVLSLTAGSPTYHVAFGSDPDLPAIPPGALDLTQVPQQGLPPNPYFEDGTLQLVATAFPGSRVADTFFVQSDVAVPGPIAGAGLPGLIAACGGLFAWWRRRQKIA